MASRPDEVIAGIDEAGRGCLAGPVVAAAVTLPEVFRLPGLDDSKRLTSLARERLEPRIKACAKAWSLGVVWPGRIDAVNILNATLEAMARAAAHLAMKPDLLLIDGNCVIKAEILAPIWRSRHLPGQKAIIGGDASEPAISAASILAKTFRDRLMAALDRRYPQYGFARHKGYGTAAHFQALAKFGPCPMHRLTFRGVLQHQPRLPL